MPRIVYQRSLAGFAGVVWLRWGWRTLRHVALSGLQCCLILGFWLGWQSLPAHASPSAPSESKAAEIERTGSGAIVGSVTDPQQALVAGARITLTDLATSRVLTIVSDGRGAYRLSSLPNATYGLEVSAAGFKTTVIQKIEVVAGNIVTQNIALSLGAASEIVHVYGVERKLGEITLNTPTTEDVVPKTMVTSLLNEAQTGSYKALAMLPSVNDQSGDAYGLALGKTLRLRGAFASDEFLRNVEGLPVSDHGGGGDFMDFENVQEAHVYRGPIPSAESFGVRNMTGGEDLSLLWPKDNSGASVKQSWGGDGFERTFARIDSGLLPSGTALFASFSTASANNWRGPGGQPNDKYNYETSVSQQLGHRAKLKVFGVHQQFGQDDFRALSYSQALNLGNNANYYYAYNATLSGVPATDQNYYAFTRQSYNDTMVLATFEATLPKDSQLTIKPYYWEDNGYRLIGGKGGYSYMETEPHEHGLTAEYDWSIKPVQFSVGTWWGSIADPLPPPLAQKQYTLSATTPGTYSATFQGWTTLEKASNRDYYSPYVQAQTTLGKTSFTGSLKYLYQDDPSMTYYVTTGIPDVSYEQAFAGYNPTVKPGMQIGSRIWHYWEPYFSVVHAITGNTTAYFSYGQGYELTSWSGQTSAYTSNQAAFQKAGIGLNQLWNSLQPERLRNFDVGLRYKTGIFTVAPTFFYSIDNNKAISVYDPVIGAPYLQSNVDATSKGAELELTAQPPLPGPGVLLFYLSGSYNEFTYNDDVRNLSNNTVPSQDKQIADTPKNMMKLAANYLLHRFSISPALRYLGARYGDVANTQRVAGYLIGDLYTSYQPRTGALKNTTLSFSVLNLMDRRYIGLINTSDFSLSSSTTYYPGAPRTIMGGISFGVDNLFKGFRK
jgi:iron complex outermembrane receptor protein